MALVYTCFQGMFHGLHGPTITNKKYDKETYTCFHAIPRNNVTIALILLCDLLEQIRKLLVLCQHYHKC